jgi:hypothetical protein
MTDIYENFEIHVLDIPTANTAVRLPDPIKYGTVRQPQEIIVQSPTTNTVSIWVGGENVDATLTNGGWEIPIGADSRLPSSSDELMWAVASADNQKLIITYLAGKAL